VSRIPLRWAIPGVAAFLLVLVARLPAAWFLPLLPSSVRCAVVQGTLWSGSCAGMQVETAPGRTLALDRLDWSLRPVALLRARLGAEVRLFQGGGEASAVVSLRPSNLNVDSLEGRLPLDHRLLPLLPAGWRGDFSARDVSFTLDAGNLTRLSGTVRVHEIIDAENDPLGSYELSFSQSAGGESEAPPFVGLLRDVGGVLAVDATARIQARGAWQVDGRITPRAGASPGLVRQIRVLGLAAADGSYPFSIAGE
jgi:hypothetical protein